MFELELRIKTSKSALTTETLDKLVAGSPCEAYERIYKLSRDMNIPLKSTATIRQQVDMNIAKSKGEQALKNLTTRNKGMYRVYKFEM